MKYLKLIVSGCILSLMVITTSCNKQGPEGGINDELKNELQAALLENGQGGFGQGALFGMVRLAL